MEFRVFGLGQCSLDYLVEVEAYPPSDAKCEFQTLEAQGGGPVATALVALSRWRVPSTFAGVIGDDEFGARIRASLENEKIDLSGLRVRKGCASQFAFVVAEPGRGTRTVFWRRPTGQALTTGEIDTDRLRRAEMLYTDGLMIDAALAAARLAMREGVRVVVDAGACGSWLGSATRSSCRRVSRGDWSEATIPWRRAGSLPPSAPGSSG